jgi:uncharacterized membrane protein (DUF2068 family)
MAEPKRHKFLLLIAAFKLVKAGLLLIVAAATFRLLKDGFTQRIIDWLDDVPVANASHAVADFIDWLLVLTPQRIELLGTLACAYAGVYIVEGVGLWRERRWAEYLTSIMTASLIPFEVYELFHDATPLKYTALAINIIILAYLIYLLRQKKA